jgi:protein kinase
MPLSEGDELTGEHGKTYLAVSPLGQDNVWTAVETGNSKVVVVKEPDAQDASRGYPAFQNEMVMHELLKDSSGIRQQVDRIPSTKPGDPPMLVLEITDTTLWGARTKRPFTLAELKSVTKDALIGLRQVHEQGLVYADLKMQNIMLDGFDGNAKESKMGDLHASLGDLGIVLEPMKGTVQPVSYRAPEVYFKKDVTAKADIWGWGLIYCHLLEARKRFEYTGLYDEASGTMAQREAATAHAVANDYGLFSDKSYAGVPLPQNDKNIGKGDQWELLRLRGLEEGEVDFLKWVLRADPKERPGAAQILETGWLDKTDAEVAQGFRPPGNGTRGSNMAFDSQRTGFAEPATYLNNRRPDNTGAQVSQGSQPAGQAAGAEGPHVAPDSKPKGFLSSFFNFRRSEDTSAEVAQGSQPTGQGTGPEGPHMTPDSKPKALVGSASYFNNRQPDHTGAEVVQGSQPAGQAAGPEGSNMPSDWKPTTLAGSGGYFNTVRPDNSGAEVAQASQPQAPQPQAPQPQVSQSTGQAASAGGPIVEPDSKPKGFASSATQRIFGA